MSASRQSAIAVQAERVALLAKERSTPEQLTRSDKIKLARLRALKFRATRAVADDVEGGSIGLMFRVHDEELLSTNLDPLSAWWFLLGGCDKAMSSGDVWYNTDVKSRQEAVAMANMFRKWNGLKAIETLEDEVVAVAAGMAAFRAQLNKRDAVWRAREARAPQFEMGVSEVEA